MGIIAVMNIKTMDILRFLCLIARMLVSTTAWAQVSTITLNGWSGGWCAIPCGDGSYDCSNGHGGWTPNVNFTDTVPAGHVITNITSNVFVHNCSSSSTVTTSINGTTIGAATTGQRSCSCSNSPCLSLQAVSTTYPNGFPGYVYGGRNTFYLAVSGLVCVSHATLTIESVPSSALTVTVTVAKPLVEPTVSNKYRKWIQSSNRQNQTPVTVTVTGVNGAGVIEAVTGATVDLTVERASIKFGGHNHDAATIDASIRPLGYVTDTSGITNAQGMFSTFYTSSTFASEDKIKAVVSFQGSIGEAISEVVTAERTNLLLLNVNAPHILYGGTDHHTGPNFKKASMSPDHTHWLSKKTMPVFQALLNLYSQENFGAGLKINDASLIKGGRFEGITQETKRNPVTGVLLGEWSGSHTTHSLGTDVDVGLIDIRPDGSKGESVLYHLRDLKGVYDDAYRKAELHPFPPKTPTHVHIYFNYN